MGKVNLKRLDDVSPFRKVAMGTWRTAKDPSVYGLAEIDITETLAHLEAYANKHDVKISPAHLVGKAAAYCLQRRPESNAMIRGGRIYLRKHVSLFYQVNIPGEGADKIKKATLSGCTIHHAENLSTAGIARAMAEKVELVRSHKDRELAGNLAAVKKMPWWMTRYYLDIASWLIYGLNMDLSWIGIPKDPFGSIMITNVGSLGIDLAWAPLCPYTRVPLLLTVGLIQAKPWVVDGKVEVRSIMPVCVTFDHRVIDGVHVSQLAYDFKKCFAEPMKYLFHD